VGLISASSSPAATGAELLAVELSPRLVMWTSTEIQGWPNLCATRVAAAFGHCRDMVCGTAVFTGARDTQANPTSPVRHAGRPCARPDLTCVGDAASRRWGVERQEEKDSAPTSRKCQ
jgi:hypothetical protein